MSIEDKLSPFFKPEVRRGGLTLFEKEAVVLSSLSDTLVQGYVRKTTSAKVTLKAQSLQDTAILADCSCPVASRGVLCKHIWAVLLQAEKKEADFLLEKESISKLDTIASSAPSQKAKQAEYRKQQYAKQKARMKEQRLSHKKSTQISKNEKPLSEAVQRAYDFFSSNGFPMENPVEEEALKEARKKLSRIFHPDKGGTHEEVLALNHNFEVLWDFLKA